MYKYVWHVILYQPTTTAIYTLSLHDALPICRSDRTACRVSYQTDSSHIVRTSLTATSVCVIPPRSRKATDRKSTRLNSSHVEISYAVFCLKKKYYAQIICIT